MSMITLKFAIGPGGLLYSGRLKTAGLLNTMVMAKWSRVKNVYHLCIVRRMPQKLGILTNFKGKFIYIQSVKKRQKKFINACNFFFNFYVDTLMFLCVHCAGKLSKTNPTMKVIWLAVF